MYSVLKIARRAKISLLIIAIPGASTKFQKISRSCRQPGIAICSDEVKSLRLLMMPTSSGKRLYSGMVTVCPVDG